MAIAYLSLLPVLGMLANLAQGLSVEPPARQDHYQRKPLVRELASTSNFLSASDFPPDSLSHQSDPKTQGAAMVSKAILSTASTNSYDSDYTSDYTDEDVRGFLDRFLSSSEGKSFGNCVGERAKDAMDAGFHHAFPKYSRKTWQDNLAPPIHEDLKHQQKFNSSGIAVLVSGQVRTGIYPNIVEKMRENVFDVLKRHSPGDSVEVFAMLAFTSGGYHEWQGLGHLSQNVDISRSAVEEMLEGYGVKYTLEEFTGSNRFPDFRAEGCCSEAHPEEGCANDHDMGEQWLKVHGAIEMMKEAETGRGQRYSYVVRLRPDLYVKKIHLEPPFEHDAPIVCAIGGAGNDAFLTMPRWAVEAMDGMWRLARDCPVPGVDECRTKELLKYCASSLGDSETCNGLLWVGMLRFGMPVSGCQQDLDFARPRRVGS